MKIDVIYFNEGAGHYTSAVACKDILEREGHFVELLNLGIFDTPYQSKPNKTVSVQNFYHHRNTDMVISVVPFFNKFLCEFVKQASRRILYVTLVLELSESRLDYWIPPIPIDQHLIVGTESLVNIAKSHGYADDRIHKTSGIVIHRLFYDKTKRDMLREKLGFDKDEKVGLVMFGGGVATISPQLTDWANSMVRLKASLEDKAIVFLCGKNMKAYQLLKAVPLVPEHLIYFNTNSVYEYMHASDYCIGKPGTVFLSEALVTGNVVYTAKPGIPNPQETFGLDYIRDKHLGIGSDNFNSILTDLDKLFKGFDGFKKNVDKEHNQAIFELPGIVSEIEKQKFKQIFFNSLTETP